MTSDCYEILGVDRHANPSQIRRAFRRLAHQIHPDQAGGQATARFHALKEAYETLSDAARRAEHDRALQRRETLSRRTAPPAISRPLHLFDNFASFYPGREAIEQVLSRNFTGRRIPKSQPVHEVRLDVQLTPAQASAGGSLPLDVPVARVCDRCGGSGVSGFYTCDLCDGHGVDWSVARVDVLLRPPVRNGMVVPVSLRHIGVRNMYLSVHLHVCGG